MACTVESLVEKLKEVKTGTTGYAQVIAECEWKTEDFDKFIFYSDEYYTRNLIHTCKEFELVLLCWEKGQKTPIHNHPNSEGWLRVIKGEVEEHIFTDPDKDPSGTPILLEKKTGVEKDFTHINDSIGLHDIANKADGRTVTLHLYAPTFTACNYYCPDSKEIKLKELCFYSEHGEIVKKQ